MEYIYIFLRTIWSELFLIEIPIINMTISTLLISVFIIVFIINIIKYFLVKEKE